MNAPMPVDRVAGFGDPVRDAQATFRCIMSAMAQPGTIATLTTFPEPPTGVGNAMAAVALTLCAYETPVWLDAALRTSRSVVEYLHLHTGARVCDATGKAAFALVSTCERLPELATFAQGTLEFPDTSTTIILEVKALDTAGAWRLTGPGIAKPTSFEVAPLPIGFEAALNANRQLYPRGVDLILCCGDRLAALPRSTRIERGG